mmetsp:Transcript_12880/g.29055  ORF Transcript_12880/g.29055 Transcript_12880/m.29055 type:complete len:107 (+) Transcript_12880:155-475(+)
MCEVNSDSHLHGIYHRQAEALWKRFGAPQQMAWWEGVSDTELGRPPPRKRPSTSFVALSAETDDFAMGTKGVVLRWEEEHALFKSEDGLVGFVGREALPAALAPRF